MKLNGENGSYLGTYEMNEPVSGLTYENGNLYGLRSNGNIVTAVASHLKTSPATWVNHWTVVKSEDSGLRSGLVFRNSVAYGFNATRDKVQAESGNPTITTTPSTTSSTGSVPSTGSSASTDAAAPAPNPASGTTPSPAPDPASP